ncbi:MAG: hypothetical protein LH472_12310 [Pyrinomonadaceae bacterium]|nr:hypothetical protein [Pyrinomonadaceae bacterium]
MINENILTKVILTTFFLTTTFAITNAQSVAVISEKTGVEPGQSLRQAIDNYSPAAPTVQTAGVYIRPTADQRFKRYVNKTIGTGLIGVGIGAAIQQLAEVPPEWENNFKGFARRFGSNFGENAIQETTAYGIEEVLKLDSKFYKSKKRDFGSRFKNALLSGVTARTPGGKRVFNPAPIIGSYTANLISTQVWYPKRYNYQDGLRQGTQGIGFTIGFGLLNEFLLNRK